MIDPSGGVCYGSDILFGKKGTVWMGLFMAPGLPLVNVIKLILIMYIKVLRLELYS